MLQDHTAPPVDGPPPPATTPTEAEYRRARRIRHDLWQQRPVKAERLEWLTDYERRFPGRKYAPLPRRGRPVPREQVGVERILDAVAAAQVVQRDGRRFMVMEVDVDSPLFAVIDRWCEEQETRPTTLEPAWSEGSRR